ncbi:MAG: RidA family protein [Bacteroidetes bacterium]|nr:RidA family protein [Bacteroidota bacterium]
MMKKIIKISNVPQPLATYSQAVLTNGTLYVSGQIGIDPKSGKLVAGDVSAQCKQVMINIGNILKEAGMDYANVVKCSVFMKDMNDYAAINKVYGEYFHHESPAREAVSVVGLPINVDVEISCIATK